MKIVLVSGGAGYIGSVLVRQLLQKGYAVRVVDALLFGGEPILDLLTHPHFSFLKGDIRNAEILKQACEGMDYVAHLAAIVGDPACAAQPEITKETNVLASKSFYQIANAAGVTKFVFASTCSNYGKMPDEAGYVTEDSELAPVSLYAETKVEVEKYLLNQPKDNSCKPTCLRFSTVYGLSLRPRFDLTVNEFTKEVALNRKLVIFGEQFWRPYCHVNDLAASVELIFASPSEKTEFEVFNVGDTGENYQKKMIAEELLKIIPDATISYVSKTEDPRDYRVNFDKIKNELGFKITRKLPDGIREIKQAVCDEFIANPDDIKYRNS